MANELTAVGLQSEGSVVWRKCHIEQISASKLLEIPWCSHASLPALNVTLNLDDLDSRDEGYAIAVVDRVLERAIACQASDIHFERNRDAIAIRFRIDGRLIDVVQCKEGSAASILGRLKALSRLVTYRQDIPQEGRLALTQHGIEARVGTLPTLHGERAVVRLGQSRATDWSVRQLGLPTDVKTALLSALERSSGVVLITGAAGAGKTTTAYACLRELLAKPVNRSIVTLEDPIEFELLGVAQSQVNPTGGYAWSDGLKALLRQDPEVMLVGEIREAETARVVFQAAMTGQLVITTMHARSAGDAVRRLLDMAVPAHYLRSVLEFLLCQRLVSTACPACEAAVVRDSHKASTNCEHCHGTGVLPRSVQCELLPPVEGPLAEVLQDGADSRQIERTATLCGMSVFP